VVVLRGVCGGSVSAGFSAHGYGSHVSGMRARYVSSKSDHVKSQGVTKDKSRLVNPLRACR